MVSWLSSVLSVVLASPAHAADCAEPVPVERVQARIDDAEVAFGALDLDGFRGAAEDAALGLPCVDALVSPELAARTHRLYGLQRFVARDEDGAARAFAAARHAAPGLRLPESLVDQDGDGFVHVDFADEAGGSAPGEGDCDDTDPDTAPGADEIPYDGVDQSCDGLDLVDVDADGWPGLSFEAWSPAHDGVAWPDGLYDEVDCDDTRADVNAEAVEVWYDGIDQDCDEANDFDRDFDGYVHEDFPTRVGGTAPLQGDCDDRDPEVNPGAECDPLSSEDNNCSGRPGCL